MWDVGRLQVHGIRSCCTKKWLSFGQTIRNLDSGDLGILLVVSRLGVTGLKKTRVVYLLDLFEGREWEVWFSACGALSYDWANGGYVDVLFTCGECGFGSLGSWTYSKEWIWNLGKIVCWSETSAGWLSKNLMLGIDSCGIPSLTSYLWPSGWRTRVQLRKSEFNSRGE